MQRFHALQFYCDQDGVIVDFWGTVIRTFGIAHTHWYDIDKKKFWKPINDLGATFWEGLPWLPGARELWRRLQGFDPIILTARSGHPLSVIGKHAWIDKHIGVDQKRIVCYRSEKVQHAMYDLERGICPILIDDQPRNVLEWREVGGYAYQYPCPWFKREQDENNVFSLLMQSVFGRTKFQQYKVGSQG